MPISLQTVNPMITNREEVLENAPLRPDQELSLQSIRATVTGKYIIKDNDSDK